eukprot:3380902-Pyramimonas_sp.AAC.1
MAARGGWVRLHRCAGGVLVASAATAPSLGSVSTTPAGSSALRRTPCSSLAGSILMGTCSALGGSSLTTGSPLTIGAAAAACAAPEAPPSTRCCLRRSGAAEESAAPRLPAAG